MVSFIISLAALVLGYLLYGKFVAHVFGPDDRPTPAVAKADGVDFMVLPSWKIFMIQFLNIAGTGPIFGAIMGAWYGPVAYLWIVFGCIFAGAMHDYMSGMLSIRHDGAGLPELVGKYLGGNTKKVMLVFSVLLLMMGVPCLYIVLPLFWMASAIRARSWEVRCSGLSSSSSTTSSLRFCLSTRLSERYILSLPSRCFSWQVR